MAGMDATDEMFDLRMSDEARPLLDKVTAFVADEVEPMSEEFERIGRTNSERWTWAPGQLEILEEAKTKAKELGLWNFFLPDAKTGTGLSNLDYAYAAAELADGNSKGVFRGPGSRLVTDPRGNPG